MATVLAALIAAFLGSWLGAFAALLRFKKERAFEKQLSWYEAAIKALHYLAERIEIASTFQEEEGKASKARKKVLKEELKGRWRDVQGAHIDLEAVIWEAPLFASAEAAQNCNRISKVVQEVAEETEAFDLPNYPRAVDKLSLIDKLPPQLQDAAKPLAKEARRHLGIR